MTDPYARLRKLRTVIDGASAARAERSAVWHRLAEIGLNRTQIAAVSGLVPTGADWRAGNRAGKVVDAEIRRHPAPEGDPYGLAGLSATQLYARLVRVGRKLAASSEAMGEREAIWRQLLDAGQHPGPIAAASSVHPSYPAKYLARQAEKVDAESS